MDSFFYAALITQIAPFTAAVPNFPIMLLLYNRLSIHPSLLKLLSFPSTPAFISSPQLCWHSCSDNRTAELRNCAQRVNVCRLWKQQNNATPCESCLNHPVLGCVRLSPSANTAAEGLSWRPRQRRRDTQSRHSEATRHSVCVFVFVSGVRVGEVCVNGLRWLGCFVSKSL